jgi:hypothetical protein
MYLFSRSARLGAGKFRDAGAWAVGITEKVNQITEINVSLWAPVFSPGVGTLVWSSMVQDLAELENAEAKLLVDDAYVSEIDRGAEFLSAQGVDDHLSQLVHGELDPDQKPAYVAVVTSVLAAGNFGSGIALGIEVCERVKQITGVPTAFAIDSTGAYGGVSWISAHANVQELERSEQAINSDAGFMEFIDSQVSHAYQPSGTAQTVYRRLA